jgi:hypothetical protein
MALLKTVARAASTLKFQHFFAVGQIRILASRRRALTMPARGDGASSAAAASRQTHRDAGALGRRVCDWSKTATWLFLNRTGKMPDFDSGSRRNRIQLSLAEQAVRNACSRLCIAGRKSHISKCFTAPP